MTCSRRICDCELGFGAAPGLEALAVEIDALEEFLRDPWAVRPAADEEEEEDGEKGVVQVWVPRVVPALTAPSVVADDVGAGDEVKRAVLQRQALAASLAAEDYVRRLEAGGAAVSSHSESGMIGFRDVIQAKFDLFTGFINLERGITFLIA